MRMCAATQAPSTHMTTLCVPYRASHLQNRTGSIRFKQFLECMYPEASTLDIRLLARMAQAHVSVL